MCISYHITAQAQTYKNTFDNLPSLAPIHSVALINELLLYFNADVENVQDALQWWYEKQKTYPHLYHMALDYLWIPGMFVHDSGYTIVTT